MLFRATGDGIDLFVRLTPHSATDRIDGVAYDAEGRQYLAARVRAVPEKGAANAALEKLIAKSLSMPKSAISVIAGQTARVKTVRIIAAPDDWSQRLADLAHAPIGGAIKKR